MHVKVPKKRIKNIYFYDFLIKYNFYMASWGCYVNYLKHFKKFTSLFCCVCTLIALKSF